VGEEVEKYMDRQNVNFPLLEPAMLGEWDRSWCSLQSITPSVSKVLLLFELDEPQTSLGKWLNKFVMGACRNCSKHNIAVITKSFRSRKQLLKLIWEVADEIKSTIKQCEVLVMLSCHSSNQGQVFSCTPSSITMQCQFEEFCSLHDFVCTCQDSLSSYLIGIHLSSCFTLKMDSSHREWPVDANWISNVLQCTVSGSTREVYETGSQVADLHIAVVQLFGNKDIQSNMPLLKETISRIKSHSFPDLANEMGLKMLLPENLTQELKIEPIEDQVHPKQLVVSDVSICFLMVASDSVGCIHADAVMTALQLRLDVKSSIHLVVLDIPDTVMDDPGFEQPNSKRLCKSASSSYVYELLQESLAKELPFNTLLFEGIDGEQKVHTVFFFAFGLLLAQLVDTVVGAVATWNERLLKEINMLPADMATYYRKQGLVYGIHFTDLNPIDETSPSLLPQISAAPVLCSASSSLVKPLSEPSAKSLPSDGYLVSGSTSSVYLCPSNCCGEAAVFPILLYMLQLVTGENGIKQGPLLSSGTAASSSLLVNSSWSAWEVLTEVQHVMSGLSTDCELRVLGYHKISKSTSLDSCETVSTSETQFQTATAEKSMSSQKQMPSLEDMAGIAQSDSSDNSYGNSCGLKPSDLPLMSNIHDICVRHYLLDLTVNFGQHVIMGSIVFFLTDLKDPQCSITADTLRLDCCDLDILAVEEPIGIDHCFPVFDGNGRSDKACDPLTINQFTQRYGCPLKFEIEEWHMNVYRGSERAEFPRCVRIVFKTKPTGKSLCWADDVDGRPCVFNWGSPVNNRAFFPGQDVPGAMSTWDAVVHLQRGCVPVVSGNIATQLPNFYLEDPFDHYYFSMPCVLPCCCIGFAAGSFSSTPIQYVSCPAYLLSGMQEKPDVVQMDISCRLVTSRSLLETAQLEYGHRLPTFLQAACELLGPYPYTRLDIVILPRSFGCMGLANPNVVFLSPSMLCGNGGMAVRLAHEISHAWFGLLIGPRDWTEEWLTEGFATFCEDIILGKAEKWTPSSAQEKYGLKAMTRWRTLSAELQNTDQSLQLMKRDQRKSIERVVTCSGRETVVAKPGTVVQNALKPEKRFMQMPYLKGYFLLYHMASMVGFELFGEFLKSYASRYQGCLVTSDDFFGLFFDTFPETRSEQFSPESLSRRWLCSVNVPLEINSVLLGNCLLEKSSRHVETWQAIEKANASHLRRRKRSNHAAAKPWETVDRLELSDQIVLLLEGLLDQRRLTHRTLQQLDDKYHFSTLNAEIRHRWCELAVKHRYVKAYRQVKRFLVEDQVGLLVCVVVRLF
jgi:aminopeptidase O